MTRSLPTRAELVEEINAARAALIDVEDHTALCDHESSTEIKNARKRMDDAVEEWASIPAPRQAT